MTCTIDRERSTTTKVAVWPACKTLWRPLTETTLSPTATAKTLSTYRYVAVPQIMLLPKEGERPKNICASHQWWMTDHQAVQLLVYSTYVYILAKLQATATPCLNHSTRTATNSVDSDSCYFYCLLQLAFCHFVSQWNFHHSMASFCLRRDWYPQWNP